MSQPAEENDQTILVSLGYIRSHNESARRLRGAFELLRAIEEQKLLTVDEGALDALEGRDDNILNNIRKSQQDVWMYTGILEELSRLEFAPPMIGGAR